MRMHKVQRLSTDPVNGILNFSLGKIDQGLCYFSKFSLKLQCEGCVYF